VDHLVRLNVDRFYGIELDEFPAQIAQVALWLTDHQLNQEVSAAFGEYMVRIPLRSSATIANANALRTDWQSLLPEGKRYDYILGNPPFIGSKLMTEEMRNDILTIFPGVKGAGTLDFVCGWYGLAARYMKAHGGKHTRSAFVSTNSITQGEQVGVLWGPLLAQGFKIHFAHQTFRWNNEARGVAGVHCIIVGFADFDIERKQLFTYSDAKAAPTVDDVRNINPYLFAGPDIIAEGRSSSINGVSPLVNGSIPADGGNLILENEQVQELVTVEPIAKKWLRPYVGAEGFIHNEYRQCLWLVDCPPDELRSMPEVLKRVQKVKDMRLASKKTPTREKANTPTLFTEDRQPREGFYLAIPRTSSENRLYIPLGFLSHEVIAANDLQMVPNASPYLFGVLSSAMHNAWTRVTSGRLESRIRYSAKYTYNTFPWPQQPSTEQKAAVEAAAQGVLDARAQFPGSSLADLYDPLTMPPALLKAHQSLDKAVDKCYRPQPFTSDAKRVEYLFELYEEYTRGLLAGASAKDSTARGEKPKRERKK